MPPHPLVKHWVAVARNATTPPAIFRSALAELGRILVYEAVREILPTVDGEVQSPLGPADATFVDASRPVKVRGTCSVESVVVMLAGCSQPSTNGAFQGSSVFVASHGTWQLLQVDQCMFRRQAVLHACLVRCKTERDIDG